MNRAKKEKAKKLREAYESMSPKELEEFERRRRINSFAEQIHSELFPEEYDFMMDSIADTKDRRCGINPMSADYSAKVNARREELGVSPLGDNGMPTDNSSWDVARTEAIGRLNGPSDENRCIDSI